MTGLKELICMEPADVAPGGDCCADRIDVSGSPQQPARQTAIARHRGVDRGAESEGVLRGGVGLTMVL